MNVLGKLFIDGQEVISSSHVQGNLTLGGTTFPAYTPPSRTAFSYIQLCTTVHYILQF